MKTKILLVLLFVSSLTFSQTKEDIIDYLKNKIELYSERPTQMEVLLCELNVDVVMNIPGSSSYKSRMSCGLKDLLDVTFVNDRQVWITLKFRTDNVSYTDIESDGNKKTWKFDNKINLFFSKGTINDDDAKKIVSLFKKLAEMCGAKVLKL